MKVILKEDVKAQGRKGDIINVSDGYARNYLFPRKLAVPADAAAIQEIKNREASRLHKLEVEKAEAEQIRSKLEGVMVKLEMPGSSDERLYGSVTAKDVAEALEAQTGISVDRRKLVLPEQIRSYGTYWADVKLFPEVTGRINFVVVRK